MLEINIFKLEFPHFPIFIFHFILLFFFLCGENAPGDSHTQEKKSKKTGEGEKSRKIKVGKIQFLRDWLLVFIEPAVLLWFED